MKGTNFTSYIRKLTKTNTTSFPDADVVLFANIVKDMFATEIKKADEELFTIEMTTNLKASTSGDLTTREYPLDTDIINIKRVQALFDGTNWIKLGEVDPTEFTSPLTESDITNIFSNQYPNAKYDLSGGSLKIYSGTISAVTDGLKLFAEIYAEDIDSDALSSVADLSVPSSSTKFRLPVQFHELWARKISIMYKSSKEKPITLSDFEQQFPTDFADQIEAITNSTTDRDNLMELPDDTDLQL